MWWTYSIALLCVLAIVTGQLLFKYGASAWVSSGTWLSSKTLIPVVLAMTLYVISSFVWLWLLKKIELGRIYPFMALAFVLVPLGSYLLFDERFGLQYYFGITLIVSGVTLASRATL